MTRYKGHIFFDDCTSGHPTQLSSGSAQVPIGELIPGLKETDRSTFLEGSLDREQNSSYIARRLESDALLKECRQQKDCNPRIAAWNKFVDTLLASHLDSISKIETVNAWVNEMIRYDDAKSDTVSNWRDWNQTAFQTLSSGMGQCSDIARLKYETLKASGVIPAENMRLVGGLLYDENGKLLALHEVLVVNADGKNWVLNDNFTGTHWPSPRPLLHGGIEPIDAFINGKRGGSRVNTYGRFVPQTASFEGEMRFYPQSRSSNIPLNHDASGSNHMTGNNIPPESECSADGNFCFDKSKHDAPGTMGIIRSEVEQVHGLKVSSKPQQPKISKHRLF